MRRKIVISCLAAVGLLAMNSRVAAQSTNTISAAPSETNKAPSIRVTPSGGPGARPGLAGILTDDQLASLQKITTSQREKMMELQTKSQEAQREVFEAGLAPKADENLLQQKADAAAKIYAEMLVLRAGLFSQIQPPLSADQLEKIKEAQSPRANPRMLRTTPPTGVTTNPAQNSVPPKQ